MNYPKTSHDDQTVTVVNMAGPVAMAVEAAMKLALAGRGGSYTAWVTGSEIPTPSR